MFEAVRQKNPWATLDTNDIFYCKGSKISVEKFRHLCELHLRKFKPLLGSFLASRGWSTTTSINPTFVHVRACSSIRQHRRLASALRPTGFVSCRSHMRVRAKTWPVNIGCSTYLFLAVPLSPTTSGLPLTVTLHVRSCRIFLGR